MIVSLVFKTALIFWQKSDSFLSENLFGDSFAVQLLL